jgi:hypothetical protein
MAQVEVVWHNFINSKKIKSFQSFTLINKVKSQNIHLDFHISNTDISNTMNIMKLYGSPNHFFPLNTCIWNTQIHMYRSFFFFYPIAFFLLSHWVWDNGVWLCLNKLHFLSLWLCLLQNWEYRNEPAPRSAEEEIVKVLKQPREWVWESQA